MRARRIATVCIGILLLIGLIALLVLGIRSCSGKTDKADSKDSAVVEEQASGVVKGKPATATLLSSGDY
ncbi:MAG: hypothetical protein J6T14_03845, partial [Clostridia bacterium]|nr:hypothetical protein [Clostridia bacterium]